MNRERFTEDKKRIIFYCVVYSCICEVISLFIIGLTTEFLIGVFSGTAVVSVNLILLERVVEYTINRKKTGFAFLIFIGRLLFFGVTAVLCLKISMVTVVAYAVGVLGIVAAATFNYIKEG